MTRLKIDRESMDLFDRLVRRGYVIEDGKKTRQLAYVLGRAGIEVYNGYDQDTKKVILAIERNIRVVPLKRSLKSVVFDIRDI